jgi:hypothetical protein
VSTISAHNDPEHLRKQIKLEAATHQISTKRRNNEELDNEIIEKAILPSYAYKA